MTRPQLTQCLCGCGVLIFPGMGASYASDECMGVRRPTTIEIAQRMWRKQGVSTGPEPLWLPPLAPVTDFPSAHVKETRALEQRLSAAETMSEASLQTPRLRPAASKAQIRWSRRMIGQYPRKAIGQIEAENNVSWAQLQHWAASSEEGLPDKATRKAPIPAPATAKGTRKRSAK